MARGKRPTADPGISQSWYDEGEPGAVDDEDEPPRRSKRKSLPSASSTDSLYDDVPRGRSKVGIIAVLGAVVVIGGVAFALTRKGDTTPTAKPPESSLPAVTEDAGPSQIIQAETPDATLQATPDAQVALRPNTGTRPSNNDTRPTGPTSPTGPIDVGAFVLGGGPGPTPNPSPGTGSGSATTVVIIPGPNPNPNPNPGTGSGSGVSGGPQDPYGGGGSDTPETPPGASADQLAAQGQQQLTNGDATNAAINFKKALELDPNNAVAAIGMGDIAMRQGLWGAAIAHLSKASKLAPKNAYVFTLLGEAYLRTGNPKDAAANFKKALQIDPNNTRARDGYTEASAKEPPPTDD